MPIMFCGGWTVVWGGSVLIGSAWTSLDEAGAKGKEIKHVIYKYGHKAGLNLNKKLSLHLISQKDKSKGKSHLRGPPLLCQ